MDQEGNMVNYDRFSLALSTLDGAQWRIFEKLAQVFVADEYPSLRPLATMSGDGGFDGALFRLEDDPSIAVQYSVRRDWRAKITETCSRLKETSAGIGVLVYLTNQSIGAAA